jgi:monolysocardiolipin acyltransferase
MIMGLTAGVSRVFLFGLNTVEVTGLNRFLALLEQRKDVNKRQRGLITGKDVKDVTTNPLLTMGFSSL